METQLFTGTSVPKAYLKLSMPLVFSMVVTLIYNLADTYFVARTGNTDLVAGVSLGAPVFTLLMAVGNIVLDPLFISVLGLGAAGAAIATVIGYLFCDVYFLGVVLAQSKVLSVQPRDCRATPRQVGQILAVGIPSAVVNLMQSASMVLTNRFLLPYGNDKIAAMGIVLKVNMIVLLLLTGLAFGGQPLFGYYYGAGDKARFAGLLRFCVRFLGAVALVLSALVFAAAPWLIRLFLDEPGIVRDGALMLRCQVITMVFVGFVLLMTIVFQSMGKAGASFLLSVSRQGVVFLVVLVAARQLLGYNGILLAQAVADTLTMAGAVVLFRTRLQKHGYV